MIEIDGKIYRNLEEQVKKNKDDIELLQGQSPDTSGLEQRIETVENQISDLTLEVDGKASQNALNNTNINVTNNTNAIENINNRLNNLDLTYATDEDIQNLQSQINSKANQADLSSTNSRVDTLESTVTQLSPQVAKSLKTPMSAPNLTELVAVDTSNSQTMIAIGDGLTIENTILKSKYSIETIYDKDLSDKDWGYPAGILGQTEIDNKDFSKYKKLIIYVVMSATQFEYAIDLQHIFSRPDFTGYIGGSGALSYDSSNILTSLSTVDSNKTTFIHKQIGYFLPSTSFTSRNNNSSNYIFKIEGVY